MVTQPKTNIYARMAKRLNYPRSKALRKAFEIWVTPEEGEVWMELPAQVDVIAKKLNRDEATVAAQIESLFQKGICNETKTPDGRLQYNPVLNNEAISNAVGYLFATRDWDEKTRSWRNKWVADILDQMQDYEHHDWWRWQRVDELTNRQLASGKGTFQVLPAYVALEKSGCELPPGFTHAGLMARKAEAEGKAILARACICRVRMRNKDCEGPIWTCVPRIEDDESHPMAKAVSADDRRVPNTPTSRGQYKRLSPEEFLEIYRRGEEDLGFVHIGLADGNYYCMCDDDCCDWLTPVKKYVPDPTEAVDPSPFRAVVNSEICEGCVKNCVPRCHFKVIKGQTDPASGKVKAVVDLSRCVGCGQCVIGCQVEGAITFDLATKLGAPPPKWSERLTAVRDW
ncbi:MAG: hypothetical protein HY665_02600 [Chloroflexi bacterium]|nr:hypothetical protein [Chloroflexota bacterium]